MPACRPPTRRSPGVPTRSRRPQRAGLPVLPGRRRRGRCVRRCGRCSQPSRWSPSSPPSPSPCGASWTRHLWLSNRTPTGPPAAPPPPAPARPPAAPAASPTPPSLPSRSPGVSSAGGDHPTSLDAFYTQQLSWSPCADNAKHQCTTMQVPVDYAKPTGERFTLALRKVPASDPAKRLGSLVINPGGPGGSGVEYAQYASFVFSPAVLKAYDIVGFDPRGIGASSPVRCLSDSDMDLLFRDDPTPDSATERSKLLDDVD